MKHIDFFTLFLRYRFLIILMCIFVLGVTLRSLYLFDWMWVMGGYDESRDMLVARHIAEYGEWVWRGPHPAGGFNILANSPFYYYAIATIWAVARTPEVFMVVWAIFMAFIIVLGYQIGSTLWDRSTGLFIALLFAVHPTFVEMGKFLSQVNLIPLWIVFVIHMLITKKRWGYIQLLFGLTTIFLGLHIHYGSLLVVGCFFIWQCWIWWHNSNVLSPIYRSLSFIFMTLYLIWAWVYLTYKYIPFDQFLFLVVNQKGPLISGIQTVLDAIKGVGTLLWIGVFDQRAILFGAMGIVGYTFGFVTNIFTGYVRSFFVWGLVCMIMAYTMVGLYHGRVSLSYLYSLLPFYIILYGIFFRRVYESNRVIGMIIFIPIIVLFSMQSWQRMQPQEFASQYLRFKDISNAIAQDYRSLNDTNGVLDVPSFVVETFSSSTYAVFDDWANGSAWYWLEKIFNKNLVTINAEGDVRPLVARPRYIYLICDHGDAGRDAIQVCEHKLTLKKEHFISEHNDIFSSDFYTVRRFKIVDVPS